MLVNAVASRMTGLQENQKSGEALISHIDAMYYNVKSCDMVNGHFSVTSQCPYCRALQRANLADEAEKQA